MSKIFAVLFDMDGVIVNNNPYHIKAWILFCKKYKLDLTEEEIIERFGEPNETYLKYVFKRDLSSEEMTRYGEEKEQIYRDLYEKAIKPAEGLKDLLMELKQNNIPTSVSTSAIRSNVDFVLNRTQLENYFDTIIDASSVKQGKPNPEVYLKSAQALNVHPNNCIVIEDSIAGITAANNAGMKVIAITSTRTKEELHNTDLIIDGFNEINYFILKNLVE